ncbi:response regulator [Patescibacteria group bacterium]|nr:response regulator [Patescibacteria group bacterium]
MAIILLVEDQADIREMLTLRLMIEGHEIHEAENGKVGVEMALKLKPDLILTDMHMPVMNGHEEVAILREKGYIGLICAVTASAMVTDSNRALTAGCDYCITKPIGEDFEARVAKILEQVNA